MDSPAAQKVTNSKNCKVCHKYFVVQQVLLLEKYTQAQLRMYTARKNALHEHMLIKCPGIQHEVHTHVLSIMYVLF